MSSGRAIGEQVDDVDTARSQGRGDDGRPATSARFRVAPKDDRRRNRCQSDEIFDSGSHISL